MTATRQTPTSASGNTFIHRLPSGEAFVIYRALPMHGCGHVQGLWYAKPAGTFGRLPVTNGYEGADGAIGAIEGGSAE